MRKEAAGRCAEARMSCRCSTECGHESNRWRTLTPRGFTRLYSTSISIQSKSSFFQFTFSTTYDSPEGTSAHGYRFSSGILGAFIGKTNIFFRWFYSFYSHLETGIRRKYKLNKYPSSKHQHKIECSTAQRLSEAHRADVCLAFHRRASLLQPTSVTHVPVHLSTKNKNPKDTT